MIKTKYQMFIKSARKSMHIIINVIPIKIPDCNQLLPHQTFKRGAHHFIGLYKGGG